MNQNKSNNSRPQRLFLLLICIIFTSCGKDKGRLQLRLAHGLDTSHPVHQAMSFLASRVKRLSRGAMTIQIYPSQQLGTERECLELLQIGSLDITKVSSSVLESFDRSFRVFALPWLFRNEQHKLRVFEGSIGEKLLKGLTAIRLRGLCYYDAGSRSFYTKTSRVRKPGDLQGKKIRTQESPMAIRMVNLLGGSATPISWGELYTSLQQGIVDGAENNPPSFYLSKHYEVCRYYSLDEHTAVPDVLIISLETWKGLTKAQKAILMNAVQASAQLQKKLWRKATEKALREVRKAGVTVIRPDKKPFLKKVRPMYENFMKDPAMKRLVQEIRGIR